MFTKAWAFIQANKEQVIKKGLVVIGVAVATALVAAFVPNEDPEMVMVDEVDPETGEVEQTVMVVE